MIETCELVACKNRPIYPLGIPEISSPQKVDYIEVSDLHELKVIAESLTKQMFYDVDYYYVILDNNIAYRTKRYDKIYRKYNI